MSKNILSRVTVGCGNLSHFPDTFGLATELAVQLRHISFMRTAASSNIDPSQALPPAIPIYHRFSAHGRTLHGNRVQFIFIKADNHSSRTIPSTRSQYRQEDVEFVLLRERNVSISFWTSATGNVSLSWSVVAKPAQWVLTSLLANRIIRKDDYNLLEWTRLITTTIATLHIASLSRTRR